LVPRRRGDETAEISASAALWEGLGCPIPRQAAPPLSHRTTPTLRTRGESSRVRRSR
jgi:hypothetical protein